MKYEVKGLTSYGVYDGDRLLGSYESEKTAELIAEALNVEVGLGEPETAQPRPNPDVPQAEYVDIVSLGGTVVYPSNGHDKETI